MAHKDFRDMKGPLARALRQVAQAGPATVLEPVWAEAVGASLATKSRPVRLSEGELTVEVDPQFQALFDQARASLIDRLNARLGKDAVVRLTLVPARLG